MQIGLSRRTATLLGAAALLVSLAAFSPAASFGHGQATSCGNRTIVYGTPPKSKTPVKAIETEGGFSCAAAVKFIGLALQGKAPSAWKYVESKVEPPTGLFEQEFKKGSKVVRYAIQGG